MAHFVTLCKENLYGFMDYQGNILVEPKYEDVRPFKNGYAAVQLDGLWGYIDEKGNTVIPCMYHAVKEFSKNGLTSVRFTKRPGSWGVINAQNEVIFQPDESICYDISEFGDGGLAIVRYGTRYFLLDSEGHKLDHQMFTDIDYLPRLHLYHAQPAGCWKIINEKEEVIVLPEKEYEDIYYQSEGLYQVEKDGLTGYMDTNGKEVIPPKFPAGYAFMENGLARVTAENELDGFINKQGEFIIEPKYEWATDFRFGLAAVKSKDHCFFINDEEKIIFGRTFRHASGFTENGLASVQEEDGRKGFINLEGHLVFTYNDDWQVDDFYFKDVTTFTVDGKVGLLDSQGHIMSMARYEAISLSSYSNLNACKQDGKWGYITDTGFLELDCVFLEAGDFSKDGLAPVRYQDTDGEVCFGILNREGQMIARYHDVRSLGRFLDSSLLQVKLGPSNYVYMGLDGDSQSRHYIYASPFYKGEAIVVEAEPYQFLDESGEPLLIEITEVDEQRGLIVELADEEDSLEDLEKYSDYLDFLK